MANVRDILRTVLLAALGAIGAAQAASGQALEVRGGQAVTDLSGFRGSMKVFRLRVPADAAALTVRTHGGTGDCDLYLRAGSPGSPEEYDERSIGKDTEENIRVLRPQAGWWYITLYAYRSYEGVSLSASLLGGDGDDGDGPWQTLRNGVPQGDLSGWAGSRRLFRIVLPTGAQRLVVSTYDGRGDCDLYLRVGRPPTTDAYDARSYSKDTHEEVLLPRPPAGEVYVLLHGYAAYSGVTILARWEGHDGGDGRGIEILEPSEDTVWRTGRTHAIRWRADERVRRVRLEYSLDNGRSWRRLALGRDLPAQAGRYEVELPHDRTLLTDSARVRVCDADRPAVCDTSPAFRIAWGDRDDEDDRPWREDGYEPDNSRDNAGAIGLSGSQLHTIYPRGDEDFLRFLAPRPGRYVLRFSELTLPVKCHVWVARTGLNDDYQGVYPIARTGGTITLDGTDPRRQVFKIKVVAEDAVSVGSYRIAVQPARVVIMP